jgi:hypothetical protein
MIHIFFPFIGESVAGLNGEVAAQKLRGRVGTTVTVKLVSMDFGYSKQGQIVGFWNVLSFFFAIFLCLFSCSKL